MKKIEEVVAHPAPWRAGDAGVNDDMVFDRAGNVVVESAHEDDARLCAAAPDLYAACLKALDRLGGCPWPETKPVVAELRAALEKARGAE